MALTKTLLVRLTRRTPQPAGFRSPNAAYEVWEAIRQVRMRGHGTLPVTDTFQPGRGATFTMDVKTCAALIERYVQGTPPGYSGNSAEIVPPAGARPLCSRLVGGGNTMEADGGALDLADDNPYFIHPGYVETPGEREQGLLRSLWSWCEAIPMVDLMKDSFLGSSSITASIDRKTTSLPITGWNLRVGGSEDLVAANANIAWQAERESTRPRSAEFRPTPRDFDRLEDAGYLTRTQPAVVLTAAHVSPGTISRHLGELRSSLELLVLPPRRSKRQYPRHVKIKMSNFKRNRGRRQPKG